MQVLLVSSSETVCCAIVTTSNQSTFPTLILLQSSQSNFLKTYKLDRVFPVLKASHCSQANCRHFAVTHSDAALPVYPSHPHLSNGISHHCSLSLTSTTFLFLRWCQHHSHHSVFAVVTSSSRTEVLPDQLAPSTVVQCHFLKSSFPTNPTSLPSLPTNALHHMTPSFFLRALSLWKIIPLIDLIIVSISHLPAVEWKVHNSRFFCFGK